MKIQLAPIIPLTFALAYDVLLLLAKEFHLYEYRHSARKMETG
jgi:hypothetical protein